MKFVVVTLGCRTNQYESQAYVDQLLSMGHTPALEGEAADLCIVNTCTVTDSADSSSRHKIRQLHRKYPGAKIVVTGCLADRQPEQIRSLTGVDLVVLNKQKEDLLSHVFPEEQIPEFAIREFKAHTRAFVKVQDGCNSFCTYCIIPYVRGRSRSRKVDEIVREVEELVLRGYKEVVITGINVGDFDGAVDPPVRLHELVQRIDAIEGLHRIRVSSIDPDEVDDALLHAIVHGKKTCHSMHIVLQSGSNAILKRMNRKYTREMFLESVRRLKEASADFTFTTDVIVGFPGESDSDLEDTLDVIRQVEFAHVHMFPYSPRERTKAATYSDRVPPSLIAERKQQVLHVSEQAAFALRSRFVGRTMPVLVEKKGRGLTENFLPVLLPEKISANEILQVKLVANTAEGFIAEVVL